MLRNVFCNCICCGAGQGPFVVKVDGWKILHGGCFQKEKPYRVQVATQYDWDIPGRAWAWLVGHSDCRRKYHRKFGARHVPLQWSLGGTWRNMTRLGAASRTTSLQRRKQYHGMSPQSNNVVSIDTLSYQHTLVPHETVRTLLYFECTKMESKNGQIAYIEPHCKLHRGHKVR